MTSPIAIFEATLGLCRTRHATVEQASNDIAEFLTVAQVRCTPITEQETQTALVAFARYGKGRGHPAQLNLGDCFAYAAARNGNMPLLFKGDDFTKTDIQSGTDPVAPGYSAACFSGSPSGGLLEGRQRSTGLRAASVSSRRRRGAKRGAALNASAAVPLLARVGQRAQRTR